MRTKITVVSRGELSVFNARVNNLDTVCKHWTIYFKFHGYTNYNHLYTVLYHMAISRGNLANTRYLAITGSMLVHRLRRWPNIEPEMAQCLVFSRNTPGSLLTP